MTPQQLRALGAVADTGSVRGAAAELVVSQPAVSAALGALQRDLGVALVEREGRGLRMSEPGTVLAGYARRLLALWEEARVATVSSVDPAGGDLRLAAVTTAGEHVLPAALASFASRFPQVRILLEVGNRRRVWELLVAGGVDLAVGGRPPADLGLASLGTAPHELVLVAAPGGPREASLDEALRRSWLVREEGSGTRATTDELLAGLDADPVRLTLGSNGAIREAAVAGLGVALIHRAAVERELAGGGLVEWRVGPLPLRRRWHLVGREGPGLPATADLFRRHLLETSPWEEPRGLEVG